MVFAVACVVVDESKRWERAEACPRGLFIIIFHCDVLMHQDDILFVVTGAAEL